MNDWLIVGLVFLVLVGSFLYEISLSVLNYGRRNDPIPANVADVYEPERYQKWLRYTMDATRFSWAQKSVRYGLMLLLLVFGFFPWLQNLIDRFIQPTAWIPSTWGTLWFLLGYYVVTLIPDVVFDYLRRFVLEAKHGFNKSTKKTFVVDKIKEIILTIVLGGGLAHLFLTIFTRLGNAFFLSSWAAIVFIQLIVNLLYGSVFIKLFNKLTPLEDGSLKTKIVDYATKQGYAIGKISIMDASKRSTKLNAFFSGFGKFKQIVLFDTLIQAMSEDEVVAVLAHEIGHGKHKDVLKNFFVNVLVMALYVGILEFLLRDDTISLAFRFGTANFGFGIVLFGILISPIADLIGIPLSFFSRKAEYAADRFAATTANPEAMISALKVLARTNLSNLTPHPLVVQLTYSHPPTSKRVAAIEALGK
ncbi:MAG: M48 family metallopeptidase [Bacillus subtilis]|nr:M48 family metallopeptidase [Bacillus subtilis]